ncbi:MAG: hypothetical protein M3P11_12325 [Actinomycetota bacterium]|nr:hypothetical protein [Actinomycetota bacterium]
MRQIGLGLMIFGAALYVALLYRGGTRWAGDVVALIGLGVWGISKEKR